MLSKRIRGFEWRQDWFSMARAPLTKFPNSHSLSRRRRLSSDAFSSLHDYERCDLELGVAREIAFGCILTRGLTAPTPHVLPRVTVRWRQSFTQAQYNINTALDSTLGRNNEVLENEISKLHVIFVA